MVLNKTSITLTLTHTHTQNGNKYSECIIIKINILWINCICKSFQPIS